MEKILVLKNVRTKRKYQKTKNILNPILNKIAKKI